MDLHAMRSPESENIIFSVWPVSLRVSQCVCVCLCVNLCVCYQHNSTTNYNRNMKFGSLHFHYVQILTETFYKDRTKILCKETHKRILIY